MKYGKLAPVRPAGLKDLDAYFTSPLPAPPAAVKPPGVKNWGMLGNGPDPSVTWTGDGFDNSQGCGDCTKAGEAHAYDALTWDEGLKEALHHPSSNQVVSAYFAESGGQDTGLACGDVLQKAYHVGAFGQKIDGYGVFDHNNQSLIKQVVATFGVVYIGIQCPASAQQQAMNDETWSVVPGSPIEGGHCIIIVGYDDAEGVFYIVSWGQVFKATYAFIAKYIDEAWALIAPAIATKGKFDNVDLVALQADLPKFTQNHDMTTVTTDSLAARVEHVAEVTLADAEDVLRHL
jgi:hypothetical protein